MLSTRHGARAGGMAMPFAARRQALVAAAVVVPVSGSPASNGVGAWSQRRAGHSHEDPRPVELVGGINRTKSASTLAVLKREQKVFTMAEYVERESEHGDFGKRETTTDVANFLDNPVWILYGLVFMSAVSFYVVACIRMRTEKKRFDPKMRAVHSMDVEGGPSIGGPFELQDLDGNTVTHETFHGKWIYIYFGFTNCPDVCPQEMSKMTRVITQLDKKVGRDKWQPIFISIDPKRDTPQAIREYLSDFHPRILGLTGTPEQIESCAREFRVYYAVPEEFGESPDYLIDHSIVEYLMEPTGKFSDYTTKEFTWFESYNKLLRRMIQLEQRKDREDPSLDADIANLDIFNVRHLRERPGGAGGAAAGSGEATGGP